MVCVGREASGKKTNDELIKIRKLQGKRKSLKMPEVKLPWYSCFLYLFYVFGQSVAKSSFWSV